MANRYWVGGATNWDGTAGTKWATTSGGAGGASVPTSSDDVFFDANSGTGNVSVSANVVCKNLDFTGYTGEFGAGGGGGDVDFYGNLTFGTGMTQSLGGVYKNQATSGTQNITSNGKSIIGGLQIAGVGCNTVLLDDLSVTAGSFQVINGTFNANNFNVTCESFNSSNSNTRTLTMGSGTWEITGISTVWDLTTITNLTLNENTSTIKLTNTSSNAKTFIGGGETYYNFWNATTNSGIVTIVGANTFNDFKINAGRTQFFTAGTTTTVTSLTAIGAIGNLITITSATSATHTISKASGTGNVQYCEISYSTATGGATFNAINSTDSGNNTGWNFLATVNNSAFLSLL